MTTSTPTSADALIAALHEPGRENLLDLVRNPLPLTLLCMTWDGSSLPDTQAELYARYLRKMYEWNRNRHELEGHVQRCGTTPTELKQELNRQLGELAKAALNLPQERFRLSQALVEKHLGEELDKTSLGYLALRLGWLNRVGRDKRGDSIFAFYHATFQEYFAALAVADWDYFLPRNHVDCPVEGKQYRIFEPQWKQVILLWLGREDVEHEEKEGFIRALVGFKDGVKDFYGDQAYFLAAAAINEFKACSLAGEIVRQVVKWGFGYFNTEKQEWRTFLDPIKEAARTAIPETIRPLAISALIDILDRCPDEDTRWQTVKSLGKIGQGNPEAISALVNLIATTEDDYTRRKAASSLGKIDPGNPEAIAALVKLIEITEDKETALQASESLENIDPGNSQAITGLLKVIETTGTARGIQREDIEWDAAERLEKIGQGHPQAITGLLKIIETTGSASIQVLAAESLEKIDPGNPEAIAALLKVIATTKEQDTLRRAAESLAEIAPDNPEVIAALVNLIATTEDKDTRMEAVKSIEKIGQGNPEAIAALVNLIATTEDKDTRMEAVKSIEKIGQGNLEAIAGLINVITTTEDEWTLWQAAESLEKIDPGNPEAVAALVNLILIATTENELIRWEAASSLEKINPGNPEAIAGLVNLIATTEDESTRRSAASSLGNIGQGNPEAITALVNLIATTEYDYTRREAALSLGKIDPGNSEAIAALVNSIASTDGLTQWEAVMSLEIIGEGNPEAIAGLINLIATTDVSTQTWAARSLGRMGQGNPKAVAALVNLIATTEYEYTQLVAAESLGQIDSGNPEAVAALVKVIATTEDEDRRKKAAESLETIDPGNPQAIAALVKVIDTSEGITSKEIWTRFTVEKQTAETLGKIDSDHPEAITTLVKLLETTEQEYIQSKVAESLAKIGQGNPEAVAALVKVIATTEDEDTWMYAVWTLGKILATPQQYAGVVTALKDCLSDEVSQNNFNQFYQCYKLIWNCAENLPYPEFYQAWHHPPTTPHPEVEDTTPVASTPFTQHCNLALLPQSINQAIQSSSRPPNCQIICIDGSRFSDPSNPALQIYTALKKAGCPASPDGKPRTIAELQAYCEDDLSEQKIALILYEVPTDPPPQGFDRAVLNQLARFSHPPIAVVVPQPLPDCRLLQFLESDPDLIANILQWLHNLER